jgi:hypothetical protein
MRIQILPVNSMAVLAHRCYHIYKQEYKVILRVYIVLFGVLCQVIGRKRQLHFTLVCIQKSTVAVTVILKVLLHSHNLFSFVVF